MKVQQYLDVQKNQILVTTSSNHVEIILLYEVSCGLFGWNHDLSYSEIYDFSATIYDNNI